MRKCNPDMVITMHIQRWKGHVYLEKLTSSKVEAAFFDVIVDMPLIMLNGIFTFTS